MPNMIGASNAKAQQIAKGWMGNASGKAQEIAKAWIGDANGKAQLLDFSKGELQYSGTLTVKLSIAGRARPYYEGSFDKYAVFRGDMKTPIDVFDASLTKTTLSVAFDTRMNSIPLRVGEKSDYLVFAPGYGDSYNTNIKVLNKSLTFQSDLTALKANYYMGTGNTKSYGLILGGNSNAYGIHLLSKDLTLTAHTGKFPSSADRWPPSTTLNGSAYIGIDDYMVRLDDNLTMVNGPAVEDCSMQGECGIGHTSTHVVIAGDYGIYSSNGSSFGLGAKAFTQDLTMITLDDLSSIGRGSSNYGTTGFDLGGTVVIAGGGTFKNSATGLYSTDIVDTYNEDLTHQSFCTLSSARETMMVGRFNDEIALLAGGTQNTGSGNLVNTDVVEVFRLV